VHNGSRTQHSRHVHETDGIAYNFPRDSVFRGEYEMRERRASPRSRPKLIAGNFETIIPTILISDRFINIYLPRSAEKAALQLL